MSFREILGRKQPGYIFGGDTGETYESLQSRRKAVERMALGSSAPRTAGEGLSFLGQALAHRALSRKEDAARQEGQNEFKSAFQNLLGGGGADASAAPMAGTDPYADFNASLARTESGGDYNITNSEGFGGKYQVGQPRLDDFNRAMGTEYRVADLTAGTPEAAALTEAVQRWHVGDIDSHIQNNRLDQYVGKNIGGVTMTQNGLRAMAHLGGIGGMQKFLTSGGQYNPSDSNGTSLLDYARTHANEGLGAEPFITPGAARQMGGGIDPRLVALLDNPHATNGQKAVMQLMLQRQIAASAPPDPMQALQMQQAQLGLQKTQLELDRMRNPSVDPMKQIELERAQIELDHLRNPDRAIIEGADGFKYFQDTGERVLPGVEKQNVPADEYGRYVAEEQAAGRQPLNRIGYKRAGQKTQQISVGPDGSVSLSEGFGQGSAPKLTVDAAKNSGFLLRTLEANELLNGLEEQGTRFDQQNLEHVPLGLGNYARDEEFRKFDQARRDFVNAILRRESGAVISDQEFDNAEKQYFPVPGDGPEVIAQKRRNREAAVQGLRIGSGEGAAQVDQLREDRSAEKPDAGGYGEWLDLGNGVRIRPKN